MPDLTAAEVFRDYVTDGVPSSGANKPKKAEVRKLHAQYEAIIKAFTSNGGLIYASKAAMDADLAKAANTMAWVLGDPVAANNGVYGKVGASGAGSWTRRADLPFSFIIAANVGAGTPNAIQATTSIPVSSSALVWMNIYEANTGPVTVSFNDETPIAIKTNTGSDPVPGGLVAGMIVLGVASWGTFRLVSDQASAAIVAAAEGWANIAQAAANGNMALATRAAASSATIDAAIHSITLKGDASEDDGLGGLFTDADNGSADTFTTNGGARTWYRVRDVGRRRMSYDLLAELNMARGPDVSHWAAIKARILAGTAKIAVLGDSIAAGIGNEGGTGSGVAYGECRPLNHAAAWNMAYYSMIRSTPGFIPLPDRANAPCFGPYEPTSSTLYVPIKHWRFTIAQATPVTFTHVQRQRAASNKFYVYVMERTAAAAGTFRVRLTDGASTTYASATVDTYVAAPTFGSVGAVDVEGRIKCVELTLSATPREFTVILDNFAARSGQSTGTIVVLGFSMGTAVHFRNFAVSSTTLLSSSAANTTRGVTTAARFSSAASWGANIYVIGYGTNDSKTGVSTPEAFRADLLGRVNTLLSAGHLVILETAPRGAAGSEHQNNPAYNAMIREVAAVTGCALMDREVLLEVDRANLLSGNVHPSEMGYTALAEAYCQAIGITSYWEEARDLQMDGGATGGMTQVRGLSDSSGNFVDIIAQVVERPANCRNVTITAKICLADTADISASSFKLELQPSGGAAVTLDTCVVSAQLVGATALTTATLIAQYTFNTAAFTRYTIRVKGKNYRLRSGTDGWSTLVWQSH